MDRMLVVVFDNETKAYEGKKALLQLDNEGSISVYPDFDNRTWFLPIFGGFLRISIFLSAALFAPGVVVKTYPLDYRHGPCTMAGCFFAARVA